MCVVVGGLRARACFRSTSRSAARRRALSSSRLPSSPRAARAATSAACREGEEREWEKVGGWRGGEEGEGVETIQSRVRERILTPNIKRAEVAEQARGQTADIRSIEQKSAVAARRGRVCQT